MKTAVYLGTRNLYKSMLASVKSLIYHSDVEKIYLLIEDDTFPEDYLPDFIEVINISGQEYFKPGSPNMENTFTYMDLYRVVISKILPESIEKILYLDCDVIIKDDFNAVWDFPLDDCYFSATPETKLSDILGEVYTNMGVVLFNLKKIREDKKDDDLMLLLNTFRYSFPSQDVFNYYCQGHIHIMPDEYNQTYNKCTKSAEHPRVMHYAGIKDWFNEPDYLKYLNMTWKEALLQ